MLRRTVLRSSSVRAMKRCTAPAPRSKPSRTTYAVSMKATSANQTVGMLVSLLGAERRRAVRGAQWGRTLHDQALDEEEERDPQHGVHAHVPEEREPGAARRDEVRVAVARSQEPVDGPGLPAQLRGEPARGIGDVREGHGEHQRPERWPRLEEAPSPEQERADEHQRDE